MLGYMEHCVEKYALSNHIRFSCPVHKARFDDTRNQWKVELANGEELTANVVITATGQLNQPAWPRIEGIDRFAGKLFHSARWDHSYNFANKRVAVIGTGASAIQFVPELAKTVKSLNLFQRSAPWVLPKPDRPFRPWEQSLFRALPAWDRLYRYLIYWKNESRALAFTKFNGMLEIFAHQARREAKNTSPILTN
ncbi:flavin-containing monooxygenase [Marinobacter similis]|uniref:flavin-containing monooxygenase n=1 Tax=Marinobacter similis TaxID=1420916 RepID=UPI0038B3E1E7